MAVLAPGFNFAVDGAKTPGRASWKGDLMNTRKNQRSLIKSFFAIGLALTLGLSPFQGISNPSSQVAASERGSNLDVDTAAQPPAPSAENRVGDAYGKLPLSFEVNHGQADPRVQFLSRGSGYSLSLTSTEAVLTLSGNAAGEPGDRSRTRASESADVLRIKMAGANASAAAAGLDELPGKVSYYIGNDPARWRTDVPTFARVKYTKVYPGIDVVYYGNQRQLEYDFEVAPGADPSVVRLAFEGATKVSLNPQGDLELLTDGGRVVQRAPIVYQEIDGARKEVAGRYVLKGENEVGFDLGVYDAARPLVIDPLLVYSTYLGGSGQDKAYDIAVDATGNAYVTGFTTSSNFPGTGNPPYTFYDVFVSKMNPAGSALLYSTYVGGSAVEEGRSIAVDTSGNAYVTGHTESTDFPTKTPFQAQKDFSRDVFVTKLGPTGALLYSTFLGGNSQDDGNGIAIDSARNIYVCGMTLSSDLPTTANAFQKTSKGGAEAFLTKLNAAGSALLYSTYFGGDGSYTERAVALAVDSAANAYLIGFMQSPNLPTTAKAYQRQLNSPTQDDAYIAKFLTTGSGPSSLVYASFLGGELDDQAFSIAVDAAGIAYITGTTESDDFPTKNAYQSIFGGYYDAFVVKLNTKPTTCTVSATANCQEAVLYSTYLGGTTDEGGRDIALDPQGNVYLTGYATKNFPLKNPLQSAKTDTSLDAFLAKFNPKVAGSASLIFSTYLKGTSGDDEGRGVALDQALNIYVTGHTFATDFLRKNPYQSVKGSGQDSFVTKVSDTPVLTSLTVTPSTVIGSNSATGKVTLSAPAPAAGAKVTLTDTLAAATVPVSVTIPAGATYKTFTITTTVVSALQSGTVSGSYNGITKSAPLKVRPVGVAALTVTPNPVVGPNNATATVTLEKPAAPGNITVTLSSSNPAVAYPAVTSIVIPAGVQSKTFTVKTVNVSVASSATLKATANGVFKTVLLKVN